MSSICSRNRGFRARATFSRGRCCTDDGRADDGHTDDYRPNDSCTDDGRADDSHTNVYRPTDLCTDDGPTDHGHTDDPHTGNGRADGRRCVGLA